MRDSVTAGKRQPGPSCGMAALIALKVVCCGALVLWATGALVGLGAWALDGGLLWLAVAVAAAAAGLALRRRRRPRPQGERRIP